MKGKEISKKKPGSRRAFFFNGEGISVEMNSRKVHAGYSLGTGKKFQDARAVRPLFVFRTRSKHGNPDTRFCLGEHPTGQALPYCGLIELKKPEPPRELHSHPSFEIHYIARGRMAFHTPGGMELLCPGEAWIAAPGAPHGNGPFTHVRTVIFTLMLGVNAKGGLADFDPGHAGLLGKALREMSGRPFFAGEAMGEIFQRIRSLSEGPTSFAALAFRNAVTEILLRIVEKKKQGPGASLSPGIQKAAAQLRAHPLENADFAALARTCRLTPSGFRHRFRREMGISPKEFVIRERLRRAAEALHQTKRDLTQIALSSGFSSSQYFARIFRKYTGQTPREYRGNPTTLI